jgi:hypothetical protein
MPSDEAAARRATRHWASPIDTRLLHLDPEAMRRHILAQRKLELQQGQPGAQPRTRGGSAPPAVVQEAVAPKAPEPQQSQQDVPQQQQQQDQPEHQLSGQRNEEQAHLQQQQQQQQQQAPMQQQQKQQQQQQQDEVALEQVQAPHGSPQCPADDQLHKVLGESTKENLPEPGSSANSLLACILAAAGTPASFADGHAAASKPAKGTLTAMLQHSGSRLRLEGASQAPPASDNAPAGAGLAPEQQQQGEPVPGEALPARAVDAQQAEPEPALNVYQPSEADLARAGRLQDALADATEGVVLDGLESIHAKLSRCGSRLVP